MPFFRALSELHWDLLCLTLGHEDNLHLIPGAVTSTPGTLMLVKVSSRVQAHVMLSRSRQPGEPRMEEEIAPPFE